MSQRHIMVIEDDVANLEFMSDLLSFYGYKVTLRQTSIGAVEHIEELQPDLVVLDNRLDFPPRGIDIIRRLRAIPTTAHVPVILYSAEQVPLETHRDEVLLMGGDVLPKPFQVEDLMAKIEKLLNVERSQST